MPKNRLLSIKHLGQLAHTPCTYELALCPESPTPEDAIERLHTARHEAAHLCAAIASKSSVRWVYVNPYARGNMASTSRARPGRPHPQNIGEVFADAVLLRDEVFISIIGVAFERRKYPDCEHDLELAIEQAREDGGGDALVLQQARRAKHFLQTNYLAVDAAAVGILLLANKQGVLKGIRLVALCKWLRGHLRDNFA